MILSENNAINLIANRGVIAFPKETPGVAQVWFDDIETVSNVRDSLRHHRVAEPALMSEEINGDNGLWNLELDEAYVRDRVTLPRCKIPAIGENTQEIILPLVKQRFAEHKAAPHANMVAGEVQANAYALQTLRGGLLPTQHPNINSMADVNQAIAKEGRIISAKSGGATSHISNYIVLPESTGREVYAYLNSLTSGASILKRSQHKAVQVPVNEPPVRASMGKNAASALLLLPVGSRGMASLKQVQGMEAAVANNGTPYASVNDGLLEQTQFFATRSRAPE